MSFTVRDGKVDVAIVAGPRLEHWPSVGVRTISRNCADLGLTVGQYGGESLMVRGVIPLPSTGGLVLVEDIQGRIHRIHSRAVIRMTPESFLPNPFPGWRSPALIPISTAEFLFQQSQVIWEPATLILGTGNRAFRFGSRLLESGVPEVICAESFVQWGAKRFAGWEVDRRRFEMNGGEVIEAKPIALSAKSPFLWQVRLQDNRGVRMIDVGRVVSAGPFENFPGFREYAPGSFLFELDQTAPAIRSDQVEGWDLEEKQGHWLSGKIIKALISDLGEKKEEIDRILRKSRIGMKRMNDHLEYPFTPAYEGKWMSHADSKKVRSFGGTPKNETHLRPLASVECFEDISCNICQLVCPTSAIEIGKISREKNEILNEGLCNSCGLCVTACPSNAISLIREFEGRSTAQVTLPWRGNKPWSKGEQATLLNRRGENLGTARVSAIPETPWATPTQNGGAKPESRSAKKTSSVNDSKDASLEARDKNDGEPPKKAKDKEVQMVQLDIPSHLVWEARSLRKSRAPQTEDEAYLAGVAQSSRFTNRVEILLNGERRFVRDKALISAALFEIGQNRPNDVLLCPDGSCGLCQITVDGVKKLACRTVIHKGMSIRHNPKSQEEPQMLCPCLNITQEAVLERLKHGDLHSPEAVLSVTQVGEGQCHGQLCMGAFKRIMTDQGLDVTQWIDWRFPWTDWILPQARS